MIKPPLCVCAAQVSRNRVLQVDRVQHRGLWTKYVLKRQEVADAAGDVGAREAFLWHGAAKRERGQIAIFKMTGQNVFCRIVVGGDQRLRRHA